MRLTGFEPVTCWFARRRRVRILRPAGLEPAASWFEAKRSIQLSYGRECCGPPIFVAEATGTESVFYHCTALFQTFLIIHLTHSADSKPMN